MPRAMAIFRRRSIGTPSWISRPPRSSERDLTVERAHEGDSIREAAADERGERAGSECARLVGEKGALRDLRPRRQPDAWEIAVGPERDRCDDSPSRRHQPRLRAAPEHGDGHLRQHTDPERVRERPIDNRAADCRQAIDPLFDGASVQETRLRPSNERSSARISAASAGEAPSTSTDCTANMDVSRARA